MGDDRLPIKLVTIWLDENEDLEVDYEDMTRYEAWSLIYWAADWLEVFLNGDDVEESEEEE